MSAYDPEVTLRQIDEICDKAVELRQGMTWAEFRGDWRKRMLGERLVEVLGEAVKRLPADLRHRHPQLPWDKIAGTRDYIAHANVLKNLEVDLRKIRLEVEKLVQSGPDMVTMGKLPQTPRAKKVIEYSMEEARNLGHNYVGTEHILLGLLREQEGVAAQVLMNLGLKLEEVREEVLSLLGHGMEGAEGSERAGSLGGGGAPGGTRRGASGPASRKRPPWTASAAT